jgi:hypothetical protein
LPTWQFYLQNLSNPSTHSLSYLEDTFSVKEITDVIFSMNNAASFGPDGFGPGFLKKLDYHETISA